MVEELYRLSTLESNERPFLQMFSGLIPHLYTLPDLQCDSSLRPTQPDQLFGYTKKALESLRERYQVPCRPELGPGVPNGQLPLCLQQTV